MTFICFSPTFIAAADNSDQTTVQTTALLKMTSSPEVLVKSIEIVFEEFNSAVLTNCLVGEEITDDAFCVRHSESMAIIGTVEKEASGGIFAYLIRYDDNAISTSGEQFYTFISTDGLCLRV
ncbi:hypothetical protein DRH27_02925 [Candidatus Falkowbacteria bacterium]|nr:MAG: hypothetical protein DRH27_02925 [Candidatus Falkowbacteria bacterium]